MVEFECSFKKCFQKPEKFCSCTDPPSLLCAQHFHSPVGPNHPVSNIKNLLTPDIKNDIIQELSDKIRKIKIQKKEIIDETNKIVKFLVEHLSQKIKEISKVEKILEKYLEYAINIQELPDFDTENQNQVGLKNFLLCKPNSLEYNNQIEINYSGSLLKKILKLVENPYGITSTDSNTSEFVYFERDSKVMMRLNIYTLEESKKTINSKNNFGIAGGICLLPNNKVFYCAGYLSAKNKLQIYSNSAYIIDVNLGKVDEKKDWVYGDSIGSCSLVGNNIYLFGRYSNNVVRESYKYNLIENTWKQIASFPENICDTSSVKKDKSLYIAGTKNNRVWIYDIKSDFYNQSAILGSNLLKVLVKGINKIFLLENNALFELENGVWSMLQLNFIVDWKWMTKSYPIIKGDWIYILVGEVTLEAVQSIFNKMIIKFNFVTKEFQSILLE